MPVRLSGLVSGMDTETLVKELINAQKMKNKKVEDKQTLLTWKQEKWKELNTKLYKLYTDDLNKMKLQGSYNTKKISSSNDSLVSVVADNAAPEGAHSLVIKSLAKSQFLTGGSITVDEEGQPIQPTTSTKLADLGITEGTVISMGTAGKVKTLTVTADTTIQSFIDTAKKAGMNASFDASKRRLFLSSSQSGSANSFRLSADNGGADANALLGKLGVDALNEDGSKVNPASTISSLSVATDSEVIYNGASIKGSTNTISVNGLKLTLKGADENQTISLNVTKDTQAVYDMVKDFIKNYNSLLKEMNTLYNAESSRGYDPLSDDEKEAMTEEQVTKWENKIKDSILRRDSTIGSLTDVMRTTMMSSIEVNDKNYALSSFGIQTSTDYLERGLLHIYGDKDDPIYSAEEDKLKKALDEDPDKVIAVLSGISKKLYDEMYDKMKSIPNVRSALTFYNDKLMVEEQRKYTKQIDLQEKKLTELENKYYKQFSAMESAMSKMQSQSNQLAAMLGTGGGQ